MNTTKTIIYCSLCEKDVTVETNATEVMELKDMKRMQVCRECYERLGGHTITYPQSKSDF
jgi:uncharacterized protein YlaI